MTHIAGMLGTMRNFTTMERKFSYLVCNSVLSHGSSGYGFARNWIGFVSMDGNVRPQP